MTNRPKTYLTHTRGKALKATAKKLAKLYQLEHVDTATLAITLHDVLAQLREQPGSACGGHCELDDNSHATHDFTPPGAGELPEEFQS